MLITFVEPLKLHRHPAPVRYPLLQKFQAVESVPDRAVHPKALFSFMNLRMKREEMRRAMEVGRTKRTLLLNPSPRR